MAVRSYDPKSIIVTVGGVPISGYTEGTFVTITRDEDTWAKNVGADGLVSRVKTNNFTGSCVITLKQTSPSNDYLSGIIAADEITNSAVVPVLVKDLSGTSTYFSGTGWIKKWADSSFSKEIGDREWTLDLSTLDLLVGSNSVQN